MEIKKLKNRGHITVFALFVFAFVSWAVFSASFLISEEIFIMRDQKERELRENKENFLEAVFLENIYEIENKILNDEGTKDIIWYFMKKDGTLMWTKNFAQEPESDNGFVIEKLYIKNSNGTEKIYDFSDWKYSFNYAGFIENYSIPERTNQAVIYFAKEIRGVCAEGTEDEVYNIKIKGSVYTEYFFEKNFGIDALTSCEIKELKFEIYD